MFLISVLGWGLVNAGAEDNVELFGEEFDPDEDDDMILWGGFVLLGNTFISATDAYQGANKYNEKLKQARISVSPIMANRGIGARFSYSF